MLKHACNILPRYLAVLTHTADIAKRKAVTDEKSTPLSVCFTICLLLSVLIRITSLHHVAGFAIATHAGKRKSLPLQNQEAYTREESTLPLWLSFSTANRREKLPYFPATLGEALCRLRLVYPLASFDVSGQWLMYAADAWPNEDYSSCNRFIHPQQQACQEFSMINPVCARILP